MGDISENVTAGGDNLIPMVFKRYSDGRLTKDLVDRIVAQQAVDLSLSCEKGLGLGLRDITAGKVLIVAGGTGILPFSDIIDLVFKD